MSLASSRTVAYLNLSMPTFDDLPLELLPSIIEKIVKPAHLSIICRVNHSFYDFGSSLLYRRIFIYPWHKHSKSKAGNFLCFSSIGV
jgi:hypothetical protein